MKCNEEESREGNGGGHFFRTSDINPFLSEWVGMPALPATEYGRIEQIVGLVETYSIEHAGEAFKKAFDKWCNTTGKNGRTYRPTNFGWVDWAQDILMGHDVEEVARKFSEVY